MEDNTDALHVHDNHLSIMYVCMYTKFALQGRSFNYVLTFGVCSMMHHVCSMMQVCPEVRHFRANGVASASLITITLSLVGWHIVNLASSCSTQLDSVGWMRPLCTSKTCVCRYVVLSSLFYHLFPKYFLGTSGHTYIGCTNADKHSTGVSVDWVGVLVGGVEPATWPSRCVNDVKDGHDSVS